MSEDQTVPLNIQARIEQYIMVRDAIEAIKERHKAELKDYTDAKDKLAGVLEAFMNSSGCDSLRSKSGTCYKTVRYSATVADAELFMQHVVSTGQFDLLERRAALEGVKNYVTKNGTLPPGTNLTAMSQVGVRRAPGS